MFDVLDSVESALSQRQPPGQSPAFGFGPSLSSIDSGSAVLGGSGFGELQGSLRHKCASDLHRLQSELARMEHFVHGRYDGNLSGPELGERTTLGYQARGTRPSSSLFDVTPSAPPRRSREFDVDRGGVPGGSGWRETGPRPVPQQESAPQGLQDVDEVLALLPWLSERGLAPR
mmetsp:Transcript_51794/g.168354  ORF Transcript_51794/g.168354 Transcript_51794/m.168354 type:complete len:174 (+) Transcript_51794:1753-2274(+)